MNNKDVNVESYYKSILKQFILDQNELKPIDRSYIERYIQLLSLFLSKGNPDYKYNYTYLIDMNEKLSKFIYNSKLKEKALRSLSIKIYNDFKKLKLNTLNIVVSVDNFIQINEKNEVEIVDNYSISNAKIDIKESIITISDINNKNKNVTLNISEFDAINNKKITNVIKIVFS